MTTTPASKGKWYEPVKTDKRDMGARLRSYGAQYSKESGVNTLEIHSRIISAYKRNL